MNCDGIVKKGLPAWLPNRGASDLEAIHVHDIPLIGTFDHEGCTVLFSCLTGATSHTSIWAYVPLGAEQSVALDELDCETTEELERFTHKLFLNRDSVFASVVEGTVQRWAPLRVDEEGVLEAAVHFMNTLIAEAEGRANTAAQQDEADRRLRQAEQARADATRQVLEPA